MTLFAGVYCRSRSHAAGDQPECAALASLLSRFPGERVERIEHPGFFLVRASLGIFHAEMPSRGADGSFTLVAGDPLPGGDNPSETIGRMILTEDHPSLCECRGTFAGVGYDPVHHRVTLVTDRLGVRPIYYITQGCCVYFASALRVLEGCSFLRLSVDLRGAIEAATFGYPIAGRTPYAWVRRIGPAETLSWSPDGSTRRCYFRWSDLPADEPVEAPGLAALTEQFEQGIALRLGEKSEADAFLSGGLDSRCIVAELVAAGARVRTYNASWDDSVDKVVGRLFAERVGSVHHEISLPPDAFGDSWPGLIASALRGPGSGGAAAEGATVWSGDGGSVGVGRVHLNSDMIARSRSLDLQGAIDAFLLENPTSAPLRACSSRLRAWIGGLPREGVRSEILAIDTEDRGQAMFLFLMLNDQHRHLDLYFEDLDINRVEYLLPFFDARFLSLSVSFQVDQTLDHRLYNRWTELLPPPVREVPWQHYPGHEPGPLALPGEGTHQWATPTSSRQRALRSRLQREAHALLGSEAFPDAVLDRKRMRVMFEASRLGLRDYAYAFRFGKQLEHYWRVAQGRFV